MTQEELATIFGRDGIYILSDDMLPGATNAVITMGGRAFQIGLNPDHELSRDYGVWTGSDTTHLVGGPFTVQTLRQARGEMDGMANAIEKMNELLIRCSLVLTGHRDGMRAAYKDQEAQYAQELLNEIAGITEACSAELQNVTLPASPPKDQP